MRARKSLLLGAALVMTRFLPSVRWISTATFVIVPCRMLPSWIYRGEISSISFILTLINKLMLGVCGSLDGTVMYLSIVPCASAILSLKTSSPFSPGFRTSGITLATCCSFPTLSLPVPALWNVKVPVRESTNDVVPKSYTVLSNWIFGGGGGLAGLFVDGVGNPEDAVGWFVPSARATPIVASATNATVSNSRFMAALMCKSGFTGG